MRSLSTRPGVQALVFALAAAGLVALFLSTAPAQATGGDDEAKVLMKLDEEWSRVAGTKDADRAASFYSEQGVAYPPGEPLAKGRPAAKKVWAAYFALPDFKISWNTTTAEVATSGDLGHTAGTYELSLTGPDGSTIREKGKYLCVWRKEKDGWKAVHDMWNSDAK